MSFNTGGICVKSCWNLSHYYTTKLFSQEYDILEDGNLKSISTQMINLLFSFKENEKQNKNNNSSYYLEWIEYKI